MKNILIAVVLSVLATSAAWSQAPARGPRKFPVGVGAPASGRIIRGATAPGGTLNVARSVACISGDGSQVVNLVYQNAGSATVSTRTLIIDPACTHVVDSLGGVVSATGPSAECTAATSFATQLDSTISTAASGGKLNL